MFLEASLHGSSFVRTVLRTHLASPTNRSEYTKDSTAQNIPIASVTANALDALGRPDEAKALRARYGVEVKEL